MADFFTRIFGGPNRKQTDLGGYHATVVLAQPPLNLLTSDHNSDLYGVPRLNVEEGSTAFWEGREFRSFLEFNIASGQTRTIKADVPIDVILYALRIDLISGSLKVETIASGTEGGTFSTPMTIIKTNELTDSPAYTNQVTLNTGGTVTGGALRDVFRVQASGQGSQAQAVGAGGEGQRGAPPGLYYYRLTASGNGASVGVFKARWEEFVSIAS